MNLARRGSQPDDLEREEADAHRQRRRLARSNGEWMARLRLVIQRENAVSGPARRRGLTADAHAGAPIASRAINRTPVDRSAVHRTVRNDGPARPHATRPIGASGTRGRAGLRDLDGEQAQGQKA